MGLGLGRIKKLLCSEIYMPKELLCSAQFKVLHLSDTPSPIYPALVKMLAEIKPDVIVHTGDIADDIKLGDNPGCRDRYIQAAGPFIRQLAQSTPRLYIVPGNHDSIQFIRSAVPPGEILQPGSVINIEGRSFGAAHYVSDLPEEAKYKLYGHNDAIPENSGSAMYLNGVTGISVILLPSGEVFNLKYPCGTNRYRKYRENPPTLI
jgi:predicted phosphodiesterase